MIRKIFKFWCLCVVFIGSVSTVDVQIGDVIDLFDHYGMLTGLFPNHANHDSLPLEFSQNIFNRRSLKKVIVGSFLKENGVWKIRVCDSIPKVLNALFENYHIDFVENIEHAFAASAVRKSISQFFGINNRMLLDGYCYVLIKYRQNNASYRLLEGLEGYELADTVVEALENVSMADEKSVLHFVSKFGSHYFKSFSVGDVIYQLFALPENRYPCLKKFESNFAYEDILRCANATEIWPGFIKTLSNSKMTEAAFNNAYKSNQKWYSNLFVAKYQNFGRFVRIPEKPVLTGFNLSAISDVIPTPKSSFVHEVINNQMKLRELYLYLN